VTAHEGDDVGGKSCLYGAFLNVRARTNLDQEAEGIGRRLHRRAFADCKKKLASLRAFLRFYQ
jgi:hypothetical protein